MFGPDYFITHAILDTPDDRARVEMFAGEEGRLGDGFDEYHKGYVLSFSDELGYPLRQRLEAAGVRTAVTTILS